MFLPFAPTSSIAYRYKKYMHDSPKKRNTKESQSMSKQKVELHPEKEDKQCSFNSISNCLKYEKLRYYTSILTRFPTLSDCIQEILDKAEQILENQLQVPINEISTICTQLKNEYESKISSSKWKELPKLEQPKKSKLKSSTKMLHRLLNRPHLKLNELKPALMQSHNITSISNDPSRYSHKTIFSLKNYKSRRERRSLIEMPIVKDIKQSSYNSFVTHNGKIDEEVQHNSKDSCFKMKSKNDYNSILNLTEMQSNKRRTCLRLKLPTISMGIKKTEDDDHFGKWTLYSNDSYKF